MRSLLVLAAALTLACGAPSAPGPEPTPTSPAPAPPASSSSTQPSTSTSTPAPDRDPSPPPAHTIATVDGRPFGCLVVPNQRHQLRRFLYSGDSYEHQAAIPTRLHGRLQPAFTTLRLVTAEGTCEPRLGMVRAEEPDVGGVAQAHAGCDRAAGSFAFADCEVPAWLRYHLPEAHIERLPARGPLEDPMLQALEERAAFRVEETEGETLAARRARLRRRSRRSVVRTAREELLVLELHHFLEGLDECAYDAEQVTTSVQVRRVDGPTPGPWEELHPDGRVVGAYFDDAGALVAFDTRRPRPDGQRCDEDRQGYGFTCDQMVLASRAGEVLYTFDYDYGMNATNRDSMSLLLWTRACSYTG